MNEQFLQPEPDLIELSAEIVAAYIGHNALNTGDLPKLIADVHAALTSLGAPAAVEVAEPQKPAMYRK